MIDRVTEYARAVVAGKVVAGKPHIQACQRHLKDLERQNEENIKKYKEENPNTSILIITHHPKILEYLKPDFVHVMSKGKILETGDYSLANDIEKNGYNKYLNKENVITKEVNNE